jgi:putative transposase
MNGITNALIHTTASFNGIARSWKRCFNKYCWRSKVQEKGKRDSFTLEGTVKI